MRTGLVSGDATMQVEENTVEQLRESSENPSTLEARDEAFLNEHRPTVRLSDAEIWAIARRLVQREGARVRLWTTPSAMVVLLVTASAIALGGG
jgi:phage-related protein